jgi:hypothetical protein
MLANKECFLCNKSMAGFVFYHKNCFDLRPNRYIEKGIHGDIQKYIKEYQSELKRLGEHQFVRPHPDRNTIDSFKYSKTYCEKRNGTFSEEELNKLTDADLIHISKNLNWYQISSRFTFKYPEHFWKFAPYFDWKTFFYTQKEKENLEEIAIRYYKHFDINYIKKEHMTKSLMLRFTEKLDWKKYSSSKDFDLEILNKTADKYSLDWQTVFNKFNFSNHLLEKYLRISGWNYIDLFKKSDHRLPMNKFIANLKDFLQHSPQKTLSNYQIPSVNLDQLIHNDWWPLIKKYQKTLKVWFIQKHFQHLSNKIPAQKETIKQFIAKQTHLPLIKFTNNDYKVELYDPLNLPTEANSGKYFFPEARELAKGKIIFHLNRTVKDRYRKGLILYKKKQIHYLFNPWMYYLNSKRLVIHPERLSLRKVLRKNGYGSKKNRPKAFNDFLITNNLL